LLSLSGQEREYGTVQTLLLQKQKQLNLVKKKRREREKEVKR
jgi:hypothetical protein